MGKERKRSKILTAFAQGIRSIVNEKTVHRKNNGNSVIKLLYSNLIFTKGNIWDQIIYHIHCNLAE